VTDSYTAEEINQALTAIGGNTLGILVGKLREMQANDGHVHDFADDDTLTVREFKAALTRMTDAGGWDADRFLRDISEHREPDYPPRSVWKDRNGVAWCRTRDKRWTQFGISVTWADAVPARPLLRMDVVPQ
jgi:hypothetical protein